MSTFDNIIVSAEPFDNKLIREYIRKNGKPGVCSYTGRCSSRTVELSDIVSKIKSIVCEYYGDADDEGVAFDSTFDDDEDKNTEIQVSVNNGYLIPKDRRMFDDIEGLLCYHGFRCRDGRLYENIISKIKVTNLVEKDPYGLKIDEEYYLDWRFLSRKAIEFANQGCCLCDIQEKLNSSLFYILSAIQREHKEILVHRQIRLFRCVNYREPLSAVSFSDLTSPPVEKTTDLRMSTKGDSVFYGSVDKGTAIREALAEGVKYYAYVGEFESIDELNLLDLTKITKKIDIFEMPKNDYFLLRFLKRFCEDISRPIKGKTIEYVPTQLITYYFRNCMKRYDGNGNKYGLDGILYSSSKGGCTNAVLFFNHDESSKHLRLLKYSCI